MPLSILPEAERTFRYEPPAWARAWEDPRIGGGDRTALVPVAAETAHSDEAVTPVLFRIEEELPSIDELWTGRISVAVFVLAVLWFGGSVAVTLAGWH